MPVKHNGIKPFNEMILKLRKNRSLNTTLTINIMFSCSVHQNIKFNGLHIWHSGRSLSMPVLNCNNVGTSNRQIDVTRATTETL